MPWSRSEGGPVSAGKPYLVGERGPELIVIRSTPVDPAEDQRMLDWLRDYESGEDVDDDVATD